MIPDPVTGNVILGTGNPDSPAPDSDPDGDTLQVVFISDDDGNDPEGNMVDPIGAGTEVDGDYGLLTINPDGSYSYDLSDLNPDVLALQVGDSLVDIFDYKIGDGEGKFADAKLTITIKGNNDLPVIEQEVAPVHVSEEGLPASFNPLPDEDPNGVDTTNDATMVGKVTVVDPDDNSHIFTAGTPSVNSLGNTPITWSGDGTVGNPLIGTGPGDVDVIRFTFTDDQGNFTVELLSNIEHPDTSTEDNFQFDVPVTATDSGGKSAETTVTVVIEDDSPEIGDMPMTMVFEDMPSQLDTESWGGSPWTMRNDDTNRFEQVGDGAGGSYVQIKNPTDGDVTYYWKHSSGDDGFITLPPGINYVVIPELDTGGRFSIYAPESDINDSGTTSGTKSGMVTVNDIKYIELSGSGTLVAPVKTVEPDDLPVQVPMTMGTIPFSFGADGPGGVDISAAVTYVDAENDSVIAGTSNGDPITVNKSTNNNEIILTGEANGKTIWKLTLNTETGKFVFEQPGNIDHPDIDEIGVDDPVGLQFAVSVIDSDDDKVTKILEIISKDDGPVAKDDKDMVVEGDMTTGNVITGVDEDVDPLNQGMLQEDMLSADKPHTIMKVVFDGEEYDLSDDDNNDGVIEVPGDNGTLEIRLVDEEGGDGKAGDYKYTANEIDPVISEVTIGVDGQGDVTGQPSYITIEAFDPTAPNPSNAANLLTLPGLGFGIDSPGPDGGDDDGGDGGRFDEINNVQGDPDTSETLVFKLNDWYSAESAEVKLLRFYENEGSVGAEQGMWRAFRDGVLVGEDTFTANNGQSFNGGANPGDQTINISVDVPGGFDELHFIAIGGTQGQGSDSSDYYVEEITFDVTPPIKDVFTYTLKDADGDTSDADLMIKVKNIPNDIPEQTDEMVMDVVEEEHSSAAAAGIGGNEDTDDVNGLDTDTGGDPNSVSLVATGSLLPLVDFKDDVPGTWALKTTPDLGGITLPSLTSQGEAVTYTSDGSTLTGTAGGRMIFTLNVASNGDFTFTILDELDHHSIANADDLEDILTLNFTEAIVATDSNGDEIMLTGEAFTIKWIDDTPEFFVASGVRPIVDEDLLDGGIADGPGDNSGGLTTGNSLQINWGADNANSDEGGLGDRMVFFTNQIDAGANVMATDEQGQPIATLQSGGANVLFTLVDGILVGYTGTAPTMASQLDDANIVFTVELSDSGTGSYTFTLKGVLDHPLTDDPATGGTTETSFEDNIDLKFAFSAKDSDGDTISGDFTVEVDDDSPADITVQSLLGVDEDGLTTGNGDTAAGDHPATSNFVVGTLDIDFGADGPNAMSDVEVALIAVGTDDPDTGVAALTSNGAPVLTEWDDATNTLTGFVGTNTPGNTVFTLVVNNDDTYTFALEKTSTIRRRTPTATMMAIRKSATRMI